jgi:hypothetical protein
MSLQWYGKNILSRDVFFAAILQISPQKKLVSGGGFMNEKTKTEAAEYFGLRVVVICRMEHCALVRFGDREFVVDAADLEFVQTLRQAA